MTKKSSTYGYIIGRYSLVNHLVDYKSDKGYFSGQTENWSTDPKNAQIFKTSKEAEEYRQKKSKGRLKKILFISKVTFTVQQVRYAAKTVVTSFTKMNSYQGMYSIMHKL